MRFAAGGDDFCSPAIEPRKGARSLLEARPTIAVRASPVASLARVGSDLAGDRNPGYSANDIAVMS
jgi:hypothetical protein